MPLDFPLRIRRIWVQFGLLLVTFALLRSDAAESQQKTADRLDRAQLLEYHDAQGARKPAKTIRDWKQRRIEIIRGMESVMGSTPGREKVCPLDVRVEEETDQGTYVRRVISYASEPNDRVPALLFVPKGALAGKGRFPAALCPHPTAAVMDTEYARELAERGYVTLTPNYPLLGKYAPAVAALGWRSGTMKAVWNNRRGLDLLDSLPYVIHGRYGAIGHSLGGHNSVFTAVFDERINVVITSCGLDSFLDYYGGDPANWQPERGWCQTRYMPGLLEYRGRLADIPFDFHELIGALAPRVIFISAPSGDSNFKWDSVDRIAAAAAPVFKLYGKPQNLIVEHPETKHEFSAPMRQKAYEILDAELR